MKKLLVTILLMAGMAAPIISVSGDSPTQVGSCLGDSITGGVTDPDLVVTPAGLPLQPVGAPFVDPAFGATLRRVSNTSESGGFETHIYSQLQAFSSDNAYLLLDGSDGFVVRRVSDLSLVSGLDTSEWNAPRWRPTQAHTIVHFDSNAHLVASPHRPLTVWPREPGRLLPVPVTGRPVATKIIVGCHPGHCLSFG